MLNDDMRKILQMLAKGQHVEGVRLAEKVRAQFLDVLFDLYQKTEALENDLAVLDEITQAPQGSARPHSQSKQPRVRTANPAQFRRAVLTAAERTAIVTPKGEVTTDAIAAAIQTDFPSPNKTAIGIILNNAPGWEKLEQGLYRRTEVPAPEQNNGRVPEEVAEVLPLNMNAGR